MAFFEFPHTRTYDSDLGWLIKVVHILQENAESLDEWKVKHEKEYYQLLSIVNTLKDNLLEPVTAWDPINAYKIYSMVSDNGSNYIAIQDVPPGILIGNTNYWLPANTVTAQLNAILATIYDVLDKAGDPMTVNTFKNAVLHTVIRTPLAGYAASGICVDDDHTYVSFVNDGIGNTNGYIVKYSNADGSVVDTLEDDIYHANGMCIINGKIYSADCLIMTGPDGAHDGYSTISVIDAETMTYIERLDPGLPSSFTSVFNIDNELYGVTSHLDIYQIDKSTGLATFIKSLPYEAIGTTQAAAYYNDRFLYCRSNPNILEIYDYTNAVLLNNIQIGNVILGAGAISELQSVYPHDDSLYILGPASKGVGIFRVDLSRQAPVAATSRLGGYVCDMYIDGIANTEERIRDNYFETPADALIYAKGFPGCKINLHLAADCSDDFALEAVTADSIQLNTHSYTYSGTITIYDGNFTFNGNWLADAANQIVLSNGLLPINVGVFGKITDCSTAHNFFNTVTRSIATFTFDLQLQNNAPTNLTFNVPTDSIAYFGTSSTYLIAAAGRSRIYSTAFHEVTGALNAYNMARKQNINQSIGASGSYDFNTQLGWTLHYGARMIVVTSVGDFAIDYIQGTSHTQHAYGSSGAAPKLLDISVTNHVVTLARYILSGGNWVSDTSTITLKSLIVL